MIRNTLTLLLFLFSGLLALDVQSQTIEVEGIYLGRNLFIRNPYNADTEKYCIQSVVLNGNAVISDPVTSAIQVPMKNLNLNDAVSVTIYHREDCVPEVVNIEVINSNSAFKFLYFKIDENSINWITSGETMNGKFQVEKYKLTGWTTIYNSNGKGKLDYNQYNITAPNYAGENRYRIRYIYANGKEQESDEVEYFSLLNPVDFYPEDSVTDWISLTREADYYVLNQDRKVLKSGFDDTINVSDLEYGEYIIVIENEEGFFLKPKPKIDYSKRKKSKNDSDS